MAARHCCNYTARWLQEWLQLLLLLTATNLSALHSILPILSALQPFKCLPAPSWDPTDVPAHTHSTPQGPDQITAQRRDSKLMCALQ